MDYTVLKSGLVIDRPIEMVWNEVKNPGDIKLFHPLIEDSYIIGSQRNGIGTRRYCRLKPMGVMEEHITAWEEMVEIETEVTGGRMLPPYIFMRGKLRLNSIAPDKTQVSFTFLYQLKFGALGRVMDRLLIRPQFKGAPAKYVEGLKSFVEQKYPS